MRQAVSYLTETPSQTAGPYVHIGCTPNACGIDGIIKNDLGRVMVTPETPGERISICGCVFDGNDVPLKDAMIEIWQADSEGRYRRSPAPLDGPSLSSGDDGFVGFGRSAGDPDTGEFLFETIKPGRVPFIDGRMQAPHVTFWIVARGINIGLHTRMYFADEAEANAEDPILAKIDHQDRVSTLIALVESPALYRFDIHLQGDRETVFFDS